MRNNYPNLVIAYHGCDKQVRDSIIMGESLIQSKNPYDWLGSGIYFWENDEQRAYEWAMSLKERGKITEPAVLGAVLDLGNCLNLLERESIDMLELGYDLLKIDSSDLGYDMPQNRNIKGDNGWLLRNLDCAVIEQIHRFVREKNLPLYDSVRGLFEEGEAVYPGSGFKKKTHIQICVNNPNCIIGCFIPRMADTDYSLP